ncbi:uncharacterized protein BDZ99DRAFT_519261 [Mytilinidion resinicola]|uniref:Uncharacterized protein n=1 Tax=Mytilinidion resinicola TaxID=574789 RepID=A0A6A6YPW5_9PEZI|nr:uncharacterized protein BDZ99DRAFT_519261 [Mytilinidion resinicola]KAF2810568.1 hypothetical protein BDZ99DRAFT_519261 [Mytilinidion resinicola]
MDRLSPPIFNISTLPTLACNYVGNDYCPSAGWESIGDWLRVYYFSDQPRITSELPWRVPSPLAPYDSISIPAKKFTLKPYFSLQPSGIHNPPIEKSSLVQMPHARVVNLDYLPYDSTAQCGNEAIEAWVKNDSATNTRSTVHWTDGSSNWVCAQNISDLDISGGYNAAALVTLSKTPSADLIAVGCSIAVEYMTGRYSSTSEITVTLDHNPLKNLSPTSLRAFLQTSWLNDLNPTIQGLNTTIFEKMMTTIGPWDPTTNN